MPSVYYFKKYYACHNTHIITDMTTLMNCDKTAEQVGYFTNTE